MKIIKKIWVFSLCISIINVANCQNLGCNYKVGEVKLSFTGQSSGANFTSYVVLVDGNNIIKYVSAPNNTTLTNVQAGNYFGVGITYNNKQQTLNLTVGSSIANISACSKTPALAIGVCSCNSSTNIISATSSGKSTVSGQVNKYILTNGKGIISQISNMPSFMGIVDGVYNMYAVSFVGATTPNLAWGIDLSGISALCLSISNPLGYAVCLSPTCKPICVPIVVN